MSIYEKIFALAKKNAKSLEKGEKLYDLESSELFNDETKERMLHDLSEPTVKYEISQLKALDKSKDWDEIASKLKTRKKKKSFPFLKVAAALVICLSTAYLSFYNSDKLSNGNHQSNHISAGTNRAILTLEDGTSVSLEKGQTFETESLRSTGENLEYILNKSESKIFYNYLTIPRGGEFQLKLSDGTKIWLNADTKLKYPKSFKMNEPRIVELLYGEAYFDVSPSVKHQGAKFRVVSKDQEVEVLGTEFNIKAYDNDPSVVTTLVEGEVDVVSKDQHKTLKPGEQSILDLDKKSLAVAQVKVDHHIAWIRGYFNFSNMSLKDIMKVLSRWYDVDIYFESIELEAVQFSGLLSKKQNIEQILNGIQNTKFINAYEIKDKTITIK